MPAKLTRDEFIARAIEKHGSRYDYSLVDYKNGSTKVTIICPKHGVFMQRPTSHVNDGQGCPECAKTDRKKTCFERYGYELPVCSEESLRKSREELCKKFGGPSPLCSKEIREKHKQTIRHRYGCDNISQIPSVKEKVRKTNVERYGHPCSAQNPDIKQKQINTLIENYGVTNPSLSKEIQERKKNAWLKNYGYDNPMKSEVVQKKASDTLYKRYGFPYTFMIPEVQEKSRETCILHYGVPNAFLAKEIQEKRKGTWVKNYGYDNPMRSKVVLQKVYKKKRENHTFHTSRPEERLYQMLCKEFGKNDVVRQYYSEFYPFACDFHIKSRDMYVELNGTWSHGGMWFDSDIPICLEKLDFWKREARKSDYYKNCIKAWTESDVRKRETARRNKLNYVVFWECSLNDAKLWFSKGCPDGQDWKKEYSWM